MRVVGGEAKGRRLQAPRGAGTRPTSDFVREAIFASITSAWDLDGARVLDLFAGTGALGIEALSRGAGHATFVESARPALVALRANLDDLGFGDRAAVVASDVPRWLAAAPPEPQFDVAFADPPYDFDGWDAVLAGLDRLGVDLAVLESDREVAVAPPWEVTRSKRYGGTVVVLAHRA